METIHSGQFDNLKLETEENGTKVRYWLSRMTTEDGMPHNNMVMIEAYIDGRWETVEEYRGGPTEAHPGGRKKGT